MQENVKQVKASQSQLILVVLNTYKILINNIPKQQYFKHPKRLSEKPMTISITKMSWRSNNNLKIKMDQTKDVTID